LIYDQQQTAVERGYSAVDGFDQTLSVFQLTGQFLRLVGVDRVIGLRLPELDEPGGQTQERVFARGKEGYLPLLRVAPHPREEAGLDDGGFAATGRADQRDEVLSFHFGKERIGKVIAPEKESFLSSVKASRPRQGHSPASGSGVGDAIGRE
jgi:hypothetical protein